MKMRSIVSRFKHPKRKGDQMTNNKFNTLVEALYTRLNDGVKSENEIIGRSLISALIKESDNIENIYNSFVKSF